MPTNIWSQLTNLNNTEEIQHEMTKKYQNTILKIIDANSVIYGKFTGVNCDGYYVFLDLYGNAIQLTTNTNVNVRIWYPKRGLYNIEQPSHNSFIYYARTANRQYRRGINEENTRIFNPTIQAYEEEPIPNFNQNLLGQIAANSRKYRHLDEIIKDLNDPNTKLLSYAINTRWGISLPLETTDPNTYDLWLYTSRVGHIKNNDINITETTFIQELLDEHNTDWYAGYAIR